MCLAAIETGATGLDFIDIGLDDDCRFADLPFQPRTILVFGLNCRLCLARNKRFQPKLTINEHWLFGNTVDSDLHQEEFCEVAGSSSRHGMKIESLVQHSICPDLLTGGSVVLDLGANYGAFANAIASRFRCTVYAVEASPQVFAKMSAGDLVKKFNFAICGKSGVVGLNISSNPEVTSLKRLNNWEYIDTIKIQGLSLAEFLETQSIPNVNLLKVDIEGAEIEVFNACSDAFLRSVDQITVEFHEWAGVSSETQVMDIVRRLRRLGFFAFKLSRPNFSDILFVHRRKMSFIGYASTIVGTWGPRMFRYARRRLPMGLRRRN